MKQLNTVRICSLFTLRKVQIIFHHLDLGVKLITIKRNTTGFFTHILEGSLTQVLLE